MAPTTATTDADERKEHERKGQQAINQAIRSLIAKYPDDYAEMLAWAREEVGFTPKRIVLTEAQREARKAQIANEKVRKAQEKIDEKKARVLAELAEIEAQEAALPKPVEVPAVVETEEDDNVLPPAWPTK